MSKSEHHSVTYWRDRYVEVLVGQHTQPATRPVRYVCVALFVMTVAAHVILTLTAMTTGWHYLPSATEMGRPRWFLGTFFWLLIALSTASGVLLIASDRPLGERLAVFERTGVFIAVVGTGALAATAGLAGVNSLGVALATDPTDVWHKRQVVDHRLFNFIVELAMTSIVLSGSALFARLAREVWSVCEHLRAAWGR